MYSGITSGLFEVVFVEKRPGLITYTVRLNDKLLTHLTLGASVAVDGVCQTVIALAGDEVTFNAIQETLDCTTLNTLTVGRWVSIERSMRYGDEIGGHEIAGHVIGTAMIIEKVCAGASVTLTVRCPKLWMKFILSKGFIAIDGSSLTVGEVDSQGTFKLHLIPETLRLTNFSNKEIGDLVNVELDHRTQAIVSAVERILREGRGVIY